MVGWLGDWLNRITGDGRKLDQATEELKRRSEEVLKKLDDPEAQKIGTLINEVLGKRKSDGP